MSETLGIRVKNKLKNQFSSQRNDHIGMQNQQLSSNQMSFYQKFLAKKMKDKKSSGSISLKRSTVQAPGSRKSSSKPKKSRTLTPKLTSEVEQRLASKGQKRLYSGYS
jgi:hypothetical protein